MRQITAHIEKSIANSFLKAHQLKSEIDRDKFRSLNSAIGAGDPFNKLDFIIDSEFHLEFLMYFVYYIEGKPGVLMLFNLRPIDINGKFTGYFDVTSPYGFSGPIYNKEMDSAHLLGFWKAVDDWYRKNEVVSEFIRFGLNENHHYYTGRVLRTLSTIHGQLIDPDQQWDNFKKKVRNNIRKAKSHGLTAEIHYDNIDPGAIREFHEIYFSTLDRLKAHKRYYYSLEYFEKIIRFNAGSCALAIVRKGDTAISTELLLLAENSMFSYLGGTLADYFEYRPNDFLKYRVINWGREKGFAFYNLGGGLKEDDSLHRYKRSFFPLDEEIPYYTGRKVVDKKVYIELVELANLKGKDGCTSDSAIEENFFPLYRYEG